MSARSRTASSSAPTDRLRRALAAALLAVASPALADRALLIGVGAYPQLAPALRLEAPPEDAARLRDALLRAGFAGGQVTMMTDAAGPAPTRAAVLAALARLAADAHAGEQVLVYFSGHGAQAPAADPGLEPDGLDELYLMADAAGWDGGLGRVPGAIADAELAAAIAAIRAKGADVWFVADTCHAGGLMRGTAAGRAKRVSAADLAIPANVARKPTPPAAPPPALPGRFAAFYAAAPGDLAIERRLPPGAPDARTLSQFSFALVRALDAGRLRSLRDLAIALNAADLTLGGGAPQPLFQGALDMPVLDLPADCPRRFFPRRVPGGLVLTAGSEEGIGPATRFRLLDAASGRPVGTASVAAVRLAATQLLPAAPLPAGALLAEPLDPLRAPAASLLAAVQPAAGRGVARNLVVGGEVWRPGPARACPPLRADGTAPGAITAFDLLAPPALGQCDVVLATVRNGGDAAVDVSAFYVDALGRLTALSFVGEASARLLPGDTRRLAVRLLAQDRAGRTLPTGAERLLLVALPATGTRPVDLRGAAEARWRGGEDAALDEAAGALVYRLTVAPGQRPSPAITNGAQ